MGSISRTIIAGMLSAALAVPAFADPARYYFSGGAERHHRGDRHASGDYRYGSDYRYDRNERRGYRDDRSRDYRFGPDFSYDRDERYAYRDGRRDERFSRHWRAGDRFDTQTRFVVVRDYDHYHLTPPRRGHYYAETEAGDLLLIAAATGLVVWALTN
ncbi:MAG: RcnB family protein [Alphaproteobacteria bacterium]|nr:RcnB family protein [Alphaproteobacteria bacterium]